MREKLAPSVTSAEGWIQALSSLEKPSKEVPKEVIFEKLGIREDWAENLENAVQDAALEKKE